MHFRAIIRVVGLLIIMFSFTMIVPTIIAIIYSDGSTQVFRKTFLTTILIGFFLWFPTRKNKEEFRVKDGFLIVVLFWLVLGSIGALPFIYLKTPNISITDAFFESFSGLTTTGATNFVGLDFLPKAILFYRQILQWFGGMGIIVLTVAILPLLGVGGMQLYRAEMPGPLKENKIRPRIAETAKTLWIIYVFITISCSISLWFAGMGVFDAITHSFAIVANGGFSTHDASLGYFNSSKINIIVIFFLIVSGCNFSLHFAALSNRNLRIYLQDLEFKTFIIFQFVFALICTLILYYHSVYDSFWKTLNQSFFQIVSMTTTAGFTSCNFAEWPLFLPLLIICMSFFGGCAGSTGGGLKVIRVLLLLLQCFRELKRLVHPNAIYPIKIGSRILPERIIEAVWGFFSAYLLVFITSFLALVSINVDEISAFSAVTTTLNNLGPALGLFTDNFSTMNPIGKWILIFTMLFGRLEIFTILVLLTPTFWKK
ncbi:TrkH family potassium uptake protein [Candidatus Providencia siddallii]|uniref:Trk system potassium uptake protein n=1 Tax=Candidatus Providencia siddallii TaxID=1715285 RepID=A0ABM9NP53_9GAMM